MSVLSLALSTSRALSCVMASGREVSSFLEMSMHVSWSHVDATVNWVMPVGGIDAYM